MRFVYKSVGRKKKPQKLHIVSPENANNTLCNSIMNSARTSKNFSLDDYIFLDRIPEPCPLKGCRVCLWEYEERKRKSTGDSHEEKQQDLPFDVQ